MNTGNKTEREIMSLRSRLEHWEQRALEAQQAMQIQETELTVLRGELKRIYDDHFSGADCRCRECQNRIKDLLNL